MRKILLILGLLSPCACLYAMQSSGQLERGIFTINMEEVEAVVQAGTLLITDRKPLITAIKSIPREKSTRAATQDNYEDILRTILEHTGKLPAEYLWEALYTCRRNSTRDFIIRNGTMSIDDLIKCKKRAQTLARKEASSLARKEKCLRIVDLLQKHINLSKDLSHSIRNIKVDEARQALEAGVKLPEYALVYAVRSLPSLCMFLGDHLPERANMDSYEKIIKLVLKYCGNLSTELLFNTLKECTTQMAMEIILKNGLYTMTNIQECISKTQPAIELDKTLPVGRLFSQGGTTIRYLKGFSGQSPPWGLNLNADGPNYGEIKDCLLRAAERFRQRTSQI